MKTSSLVLRVLAATFIASTGLHAQKVDLSAQLGQIRELLKPADADSPEAMRVKDSYKSLPDNLQNMLDSDQQAAFSDFGPTSFDGAGGAAIPELATKLKAFITSVKEELDRKEAVQTTAADALLTQVGDKLTAAKKAEDLDATISELNKISISENTRSPKTQAAARKLHGAKQIVVAWQDYLMAEETGNVQTSRSKLEQISSELAATPLVPRSLVLRLLNQQAPKPAPAKADGSAELRISIDEIQTKLTDSGDSASALAALKAIPNGQSSNSAGDYLLRAVQSVEDLRKLEPVMAESEVFANIRIVQQGSQSQNRYCLARAIDQIALNVIARSYGIEKPSAKLTSARNVLEAMALSAKDKQDWPKLRKVINSLDALGSASSGSGDYNAVGQKRSFDLTIIALLELGGTAEQHNDLESAASAYLEASGLGGQFLQREMGYAKLAALKEKSPDKMAPILAKAEQNRQRAEAARYAADRESRNQMMMNRGMPNERLRKEDLTALRPLIQEVVAEFLKDKRMEALKTPDPVTKPKDAAPRKTDP